MFCFIWESGFHAYMLENKLTVLKKKNCFDCALLQQYNVPYHTTTQRQGVWSPVGSIFLVEVFIRGFSSAVRQMSGKLRPQSSPDIIGIHNHKKSFITGVSDMRCWRAPKPHTVLLVLKLLTTQISFCALFNIILKNYCR